MNPRMQLWTLVRSIGFTARYNCGSGGGRRSLGSVYQLRKCYSSYQVHDEVKSSDGRIIPVYTGLGTGHKLEKLWKIVSKVKSGNVVGKIKHWMGQQKGQGIAREDLITLISRLRKQKKYKEAYEICEWMHEERPCSLTGSDYVARMYLAAHSGRLNEAMKLIKWFPPEHKNEVTYTTLLTGFTSINEVKRSEKLFMRMKSFNLVASPHGYNSLLLMYERKRMYLRLREVYVEMVVSGIKADALTYAVLLRCRDKARLSIANLEEIAAAAAEAAEQGKLSWSQMVEVVQVYGYLGDLDGIERMMVRLQAHPRYPQGSSFIIQAFGHAGATVRAEAVFRTLSTLGVEEYKVMLELYCQAGMVEKGEEVLKGMTDHGYDPGAGYNSLVFACLRNDRLGQAISVLGSAVESISKEGLSGDMAFLYPSVLAILRAYIRTGDVVAAESFVARYKDASFVDSKLENTLFRVYLNSYIPECQAETIFIRHSKT